MILQLQGIVSVKYKKVVITVGLDFCECKNNDGNDYVLKELKLDKTQSLSKTLISLCLLINNILGGSQ